MTLHSLRKAWTTLCLTLLVVLAATAQNTTSSITGIASDSEGTLAGAVITVVHTASGTRYSVVTNTKGMYRIDGILPGGPYLIEATYVGHQKSVVDIGVIHLGEVYSCNMTLSEGNELAAVTVDGTRASIRKTGATENITAEDIFRTPGISRSFDDVTRLSPYFMGSYFGGRDNGNGNYSIDGSNFNSNMGLDRQRMPVGNRPISLDALDEIQVVTSAFDVKNSNFLGASVNAVTKRGTNTVKASAYTFFRNEYMRGNEVDGHDLGERNLDRKNIWGVTFGGPVIKDKLFFFVNAEYEHAPAPIHQWRYSTDGKGDNANLISRVTEADMQRFATDLREIYGWDPGSWTDFSGNNDGHRFLARLDWNVSPHHHLMLRYNFSDTKGDRNVSGNVLGVQGPPNLYTQTFRGSTYQLKDNVHSLMAELNSRFATNVSNSLRLGFTFNDANNRTSEARFPTIDIMKEDDGGASRAFLHAGYDPNAWNNGIKEKTWSITDNLTISLGTHYLSLGGTFEAIKAENCYMKYGAGYYRYASYDDFLQKKAPVAFALSYSLTGSERPVADVAYNNLSLYAQDEWSVTKRLRLLYGLRLDMPMYTNDRYENPSVANIDFNGIRLNTAEWPGTNATLSPRIGFNYDVTEDGTLRLRGGTGLFTGRFPLIFFSKIQENSGMLMNKVELKPGNKFLKYFEGGVRTPHEVLTQIVPNLPEDGKTVFATEPGATTNIFAVDKDFKMPQVWKTTLAADWTMPLPFPSTLTVEGTFAKDINALTAYDANIDREKVEAVRFTGNDDRFFYPGATQKRILQNNGYAYVITNTDKGCSANVVAHLKATPVKNLDITAAYTYTVSKTLNSFQSSDIANVMTNLPTVNGCNYVTTGNARYILSPHRILATATYRVSYLRDHASTLVSLIYEGRNNGSYSYRYQNDMNNDGITNDLLYVPASKDELLFQDMKVGDRTYTAEEQREAFWSFVCQDPYLSKCKGEYTKAFGAFNPWFNRFDLRVVQEFKVKAGKTVNRLQLNIDLLNAANLLNNSWGVTKFVKGAAYAPLKRVGVDVNNTPIYTMSVDSENNLVHNTFDPTRTAENAWQLQIGVRYIFN